MARLPDYRHRDLLDVGGLSPRDAYALFDRADSFLTMIRAREEPPRTLAGRTVALLFFEPSTRTQVSFDLAARRLGAATIAFAAEGSSLKKGESLVDTAQTLEAMGLDAAVIRHSAAGAPAHLAAHVRCPVVNAGDGARAHPTQALLDAATLRAAFGEIAGLTIVIVGDIRHSRVARSDIALFTLLGATVRLCGPPTLAPKAFAELGLEVFGRLEDALPGSDVVMPLRLQRERMAGGDIPSEREYRRLYGIDHERLDRWAPNAKVMHPGPMNRGVEINGRLADDPARSLILAQAEMGAAIRMSLLESLILAVAGAA